MNRKQVLTLLGIGATAAVGGWALRRWRAEPQAVLANAGEAALDFWQMSFAKPGGGQLVIGSLRGRPLLLNFWATWCAPCIREMPELDRFARQQPNNGWQVLGLAVDQENPVREFLSQRPVSYPIALAGLEGISLTRALGNPAGGLPFTVAFGRDGKLRERHLGELNAAKLGKLVARD